MDIFDQNGVRIVPSTRVIVESSKSLDKLVLDVEDVTEIFPGFWNVSGLCPLNSTRYSFKVTGLDIVVPDSVTMTVVSDLRRLSFVETFKHMNASEISGELETEVPGTVEKVVDTEVPVVQPSWVPETERQKQLKELWDANVELPPGLQMHDDSLVQLVYNTWKTQYNSKPGVDLSNLYAEFVTQHY
jgi:hypothetical protein